MDTHVKILGWLWIVVGILGVLGAFCLGAIVAGGGLISEDDTAILVTSIISMVCGSLFILGNVLNILAGAGLLKYKKWARILAIILGIVNLIYFPIGTTLGIYTLWALLKEETKLLFERGV